ncbi:MAG TPA: hypothetical protein VGB82_14840 [Alphaproteobacteria bacterium]
MGTPDLREALVAHGIEPIASTPVDLPQHIRNGVENWRRIVSAAGIREDETALEKVAQRGAGADSTTFPLLRLWQGRGAEPPAWIRPTL